MDPQTASFLKAVCYSTAGLGALYVYMRYCFLAKKSDYETYVERTQADMESNKLEAELLKQRIELMNTPQFKEYQQRRLDAMREFVEKHDESLKWDVDIIEGLLDNIVGPNPFK